MTQTQENPLLAFQWHPQPAAEAFVRSLVDDFLRRNTFAATLAARMTAETGTRFFDWIDSIFFPTSARLLEKLSAVGYEPAVKSEFATIFRNPHGVFPTFIAVPYGPGDANPLPIAVKLKVDSIVDFLVAHQFTNALIAGKPFAPNRDADLGAETGARLYVVERHGYPGTTFEASNPAKALAAATHLEHFRLRRRAFDTDTDGFLHAHKLVDAAIADLGVDQTCALFFVAEREFWQRRNRAAQVQKARQDRLGLGWANHDHHTYRSSRASFKDLIALHEKLGLVCRERFYAGKEAGWGAQIMENPGAGIITFNDVDLAPEELFIDFAHQPLPPRPTLGTVGLWCALHGEAFLNAGMHHLECQFDFAALKAQLESQHNINVMKPFTDFPHLRQAFTEGERWPVAESRLQTLLSQNLITPDQAEKFRTQGAIGSHLENLERNDGYKGFNQKGVSEIIAATDPRHH